MAVITLNCMIQNDSKLTKQLILCLCFRLSLRTVAESGRVQKLSPRKEALSENWLLSSHKNKIIITVSDHYIHIESARVQRIVLHNTTQQPSHYVQSHNCQAADEHSSPWAQLLPFTHPSSAVRRGLSEQPPLSPGATWHAVPPCVSLSALPGVFCAPQPTVFHSPFASPAHAQKPRINSRFTKTTSVQAEEEILIGKLGEQGGISVLAGSGAPLSLWSPMV